jgi:predicted TIM-barrel fold metal-dependent hydrolase
MWSVDYPHPESILGNTETVVKGIFDKVGEARARKVVGDNAAAVWGI